MASYDQDPVFWRDQATDFVRSLSTTERQPMPGLQTMTYSKTNLLARITANRDLHRQVFEEAVEGYRQTMIQDLENQIKELTAGTLPRIRFVGREIPEDHTADYNTVIDMLEFSSDDTVSLSQAEFRQFVRDEWAWKGKFAFDAANYGSHTARSSDSYTVAAAGYNS